ncbi:8-oxo-dGTP diphosphatase [Peribacillus deserti]|uniref:8-oxo-dGTP diphosphatase n=1 Tax=Peribacillus deserti TaxID=673318 RepID=A0ABS2QMR9_9BACI|nr:8-oxo-dGTP diphosphatase [Peribacillus deserti]MBM7693551.1 8-oxo-dGTP diphosphatase [Peribacillus deserti]
MTTINYGMYTMCMIQDGDKILLQNRPGERGFPGFIAPGGKLEFPESLTEGAVREVREETGLIIKPDDLIYKGLDEYVNPQNNFRYMVFNYLACAFKGELLADPPEGELIWVDINEAVSLPMQPWFKRRLLLFFKEGTFEISVVWDEEHQRTVKDKVRMLK